VTHTARGRGDRDSRRPCISTWKFLAVNHSRSPTASPSRSHQRRHRPATGDFKMDQFPARQADHRPARLRVWAEGVDLFLTDSTNAEVPGFTILERELAPAIERVFPYGAATPLIVSSFASHDAPDPAGPRHRHAHGRKVSFVGRSMKLRNMGVAQGSGFTSEPPNLIVPAGPAREDGAQQGPR